MSNGRMAIPTPENRPLTSLSLQTGASRRLPVIECGFPRKNTGNRARLLESTRDHENPLALAIVRKSAVAFQKNYGKSIKVRAPGMFGEWVESNTGVLKMSQYDHITQVYIKKPLSQRWHTLGDGSGVVRRDIYSAFLARCVLGKTHHPSHMEEMWAAQKPTLLQAGWLCHEPAKIEPLGTITV